jgi:hypothetical protein
LGEHSKGNIKIAKQCIKTILTIIDIYHSPDRSHTHTKRVGMRGGVSLMCYIYHFDTG